MRTHSQTGAAAPKRRMVRVRRGLLRESLPTHLQLVALTLLVLLAHALGYLARESARRKNQKIIDPYRDAHFEQPLPADLGMGIRTRELLQDPCRLSPVVTCQAPDWEESPMIGRIRTGTTESMLRKRLTKNKYPSAFELLGELIDQKHHEGVANAVATGFDGDPNDGVNLISFAVDRNLKPALAYRAEGREEDALEQFQFFTDLTLPIVRKGYWVSASGLDVTDLPVLHSAFCSGLDQVLAKHCSWALLNALAETVDGIEGMSSNATLEPYTVKVYHLREWAGARNGLDLSSAYGRQPPLFASSMVARYLNASGQLRLHHPAEAHDILDSIPVFGTRAQAALWYYQLGQSALLLAVSQPKTADCQRFKREAAAAFRNSLRADAAGVLASPASAHLSDSNRLCVSSN